MILHCFRRMQCVLFAMRIWMGNVTPPAKPVRKVYIQNALKFGLGISKTTILRWLAQCVDLSLWIRWWWSTKISRDGKLDFRPTKGPYAGVVGWRILRDFFISVYFAVIMIFASCALREISILNMIGLLWSIWLIRCGNGRRLGWRRIKSRCINL